MEISLNAPKGHFGIKLECTEGPFLHINWAVWAEGPFCLDKLGWSDVMFRLTKEYILSKFTNCISKRTFPKGGFAFLWPATTASPMGLGYEKTRL